MRQILNYVGLGAVSLISIFGFAITGIATENQADFSVTVEQSVYQVDKTKTYFDLSVPVNESVSLIIHVTNNSEKSIKVAGELSPATTNINSVVEYGKTQNQITSNVTFNITKVASFEKNRQLLLSRLLIL